MIEIPQDGWGAEAVDAPGSLLSGDAAPAERSFTVPNSTWDGDERSDDPVNRADSARERAGAVFRRQRSIGAFNRGLDELSASIAEGPDWSEGLERFDRKVEELRQKYAGDLRAPEDREAFARHAGKFAAMQRIGLKRALVERQASDALTQLDNQLAYYAGKAAEADHELFRQLATDSGVRAIDELREAGYLTPDGAETRKTAFLGRVDGADVEALAAANPVEAIKALDEGLFNHLDSETRARLRDQAVAQTAESRVVQSSRADDTLGDGPADTAVSLPSEPTTILELPIPESSASDHASMEYRPGDQLAEKLLNRGSIIFDAKAGPQAGGREHARHGPGESYHFHLRKGDEPGPRISSETFRPLTPADEKLFKGDFKKAIEGLTEIDKWFLNKATREVFHTGKMPVGLVMNYGMRQMPSKGFIPPRGRE